MLSGLRVVANDGIAPPPGWVGAYTLCAMQALGGGEPELRPARSAADAIETLCAMVDDGLLPVCILDRDGRPTSLLDLSRAARGERSAARARLRVVGPAAGICG